MSEKQISTKSIVRAVKKAEKKTEKKLGIHIKTIHKQIVIRFTFAILFVIFLAFLLTSNYFWGVINLNSDEPSKYFLIETCAAKKIGKCATQLSDNNLLFVIDAQKIKLTGISAVNCETAEINSENSAIFHNCSYSWLSNTYQITMKYESSLSSLEFTQQVKVIKILDISNFVYLIKKIF